jgi:hypothetical protein
MIPRLPKCFELFHFTFIWYQDFQIQNVLWDAQFLNTNGKGQKEFPIIMSEWLLLNVSGQYFSYIVARTSYIFMRWWWWCQLCTRSVLLVRMYSCSSLKQQSMTCCCSLTHYSWFQANQSLLLLLNAACLVEKQQLPVLLSLVWPDLGLSRQLTWSGLEPSIYLIWAWSVNWPDLGLSRQSTWSGLEPSIDLICAWAVNLPDLGLSRQSTACKGSTLTITPLM